MQYSGMIKVLGGEKILRKKIRNQMDLIELGNSGITKDALEQLAASLSITASQMSELLPIAKRTIERYSPKKHFNQAVSEQIIQIAEITAKGTEVFGDRSRFLSWLKHPSKALSGRIPMNLIKSRFGVEMVMDELGRMEHGVIS